MDPLTEQLMQRQLAQGQPLPLPVPSVPPQPSNKVPTEQQRYQNAQQLMNAYRNNWTPNPMILQALQK